MSKSRPSRLLSLTALEKETLTWAFESSVAGGRQEIAKNDSSKMTKGVLIAEKVLGTRGPVVDLWFISIVF
jgi:hypothetical protein